MYAARGGPNVKWRDTDFKWGPPLARPLAKALCRSSLQYLPSCILTYSSKRMELTRNLRMKCTFILTSCNVAAVVTNKSKRCFFRDSYTLRLLVRKSSDLLELNQTRPDNAATFSSKYETFA